jgi:CO dehydrogenase/acetyl-CoA synthase alpha subunit
MKTAFLVLLFIWTILLIAAGWNNHGRKRIYEYPKRKMKCNDIAAIRKYRITLAFYRDFAKRILKERKEEIKKKAINEKRKKIEDLKKVLTKLEEEENNN